MENTLHDILDQLFDDNFEIVQIISEPTKKWSGHSRCEGMEFVFSREKEIIIMKDPEAPSWVFKPDHQLSMARWLRNEVTKNSLWTPDEQTLYYATVKVGKAQVEIAVVLSKRIEVALAWTEKKVA